MRNLPSLAQFFVALVWLCGIIAILCAILVPSPSPRAALWELGLFVALGVVAGRAKVRLMPHNSDQDVGSMSLGYAVMVAALLRFGPAAAVLVGTITTLCSCLLPRRQPLHQLLFNVALSCIDAWLSGRVFLLMNGGTLDLEPVRSFPAVIASSLTYFLINTGGVATIIALCTRQNAVRLWKQTFLWTAPSYFAVACVSTLAILMLGRHTGAIVLFTLPVAYLTYQSYAMYMARAEEKQRHIEEKQQHIEDLQGSKAQLADLYLATIKSLALAIDAKDQFTHQHILRVQRYAVATARRIGVTGESLEGLSTGALLHDIGKLGVPEYVLLKPGRLTEEEFGKIKKHPEIGAAILDPVEFPWPVLPVVKYHHERWDGTGYPEGLQGEEIPLTARVLAVADVYDALTSNRSYRYAWTHERALALIKEEAGTHFDPVVVDAFLEVIEPVIAEMRAEGCGPLVAPPAVRDRPASKADQAARDIHRAASELWALYEVAQTLSSSLGLQETLDILARKLEAVLPGTACLFLLKDEHSDALTARAMVGINREFFKGCQTLSRSSTSYTVAEKRTTYLGQYDPDDLLLTSCPTTPWTALENALIVPIVHQGEVLGTINLYHPQPNAFGQHDRQLLEMIAERAAMAFYNGLLYDRTRTHAFTDSLTQLYNVRYLTQQVDDRCRIAHPRRDALPGFAAGDRRETQDRFALLCLDLDSFKPINDLFGHQKGDQVLYDVGQVFCGVVRQDDIVARYGGDEFLIVLNGADRAEAEAIAEQLAHAVTTYDPGLLHPKLGALRLGVSIGVGCFPGDGDDCATLMSVADARMYTRKAERKLGQLVEKGTAQETSGDTGSSLPRAVLARTLPIGFSGGDRSSETKQERQEAVTTHR